MVLQVLASLCSWQPQYSIFPLWLFSKPGVNNFLLLGPGSILHTWASFPCALAMQTSWSISSPFKHCSFYKKSVTTEPTRLVGWRPQDPPCSSSCLWVWWWQLRVASPSFQPPHTNTCLHVLRSFKNFLAVFYIFSICLCSGVSACFEYLKFAMLGIHSACCKIAAPSGNSWFSWSISGPESRLDFLLVLHSVRCCTCMTCHLWTRSLHFSHSVCLPLSSCLFLR